jgi:TPR repeat protein
VKKGRTTTILGLLAIAALVAVSIPFQVRIDDIRGKFRSVEDSLYLSSSSLKKISLGYTELLSDIYWMRAIQYFGSRRTEEQNPELLYHYFDIITDLDPRFVNAYRYGGTFLAEPAPFGLGKFDMGVGLLEKGRKNNPGNFRLPLEEAFLYYFYPKDYEKAAELFREAAETPGLSKSRQASVKGMAAAALAKGGNRDLSKEIWQIIYETSPSEGRRSFALRNLQEIETGEMEDELTAALLEYQKQYGKLPGSVKELAAAGYVEGGIPEAPIGGEFVIAPEIDSVRNTELASRKLKEALAFLNSKAARFRKIYGEYPRDLNELKDFIKTETTGVFPDHPMGQEYIYNPESGKIESKWKYEKKKKQ